MAQGGKREGAGRKPTRGIKARILNSYIDETVNDNDWKDIIKAAMSAAKQGDHQARTWLTDRRFGKAPDKIEHSGDMPIRTIVELVGIDGDRNTGT